MFVHILLIAIYVEGSSLLAALHVVRLLVALKELRQHDAFFETVLLSESVKHVDRSFQLLLSPDILDSWLADPGSRKCLKHLITEVRLLNR